MSIINAAEEELREGSVQQWDTRHIDQHIYLLISLLDSANLHEQLRRKLAKILNGLAVVAYMRLKNILNANNFSHIISANALSFYENVRTKCLVIIRT